MKRSLARWRHVVVPANGNEAPVSRLPLGRNVEEGRNVKEGMSRKECQGRNVKEGRRNLAIAFQSHFAGIEVEEAALRVVQAGTKMKHLHSMGLGKGHAKLVVRSNKNAGCARCKPPPFTM